MASAPGHPVPTQTWTWRFRGQETDVMFSSYGNANLLVITQLQTMGTILLARHDNSLEGPTTYTVQTLLGKRDLEEYSLLARQIIAQSSDAGCKKPLYLSVGMSSLDVESVRTIVEFVRQHITWDQ